MPKFCFGNVKIEKDLKMQEVYKSKEYKLAYDENKNFFLNKNIHYNDNEKINAFSFFCSSAKSETFSNKNKFPIYVKTEELMFLDKEGKYNKNNQNSNLINNDIPIDEKKYCSSILKKEEICQKNKIIIQENGGIAKKETISYFSDKENACNNQEYQRKNNSFYTIEEAHAKNNENFELKEKKKELDKTKILSNKLNNEDYGHNNSYYLSEINENICNYNNGNMKYECEAVLSNDNAYEKAYNNYKEIEELEDIEETQKQKAFFLNESSPYSNRSNIYEINDSNIDEYEENSSERFNFRKRCSTSWQTSRQKLWQTEYSKRCERPQKIKEELGFFSRLIDLLKKKMKNIIRKICLFSYGVKPCEKIKKQKRNLFFVFFVFLISLSSFFFLISIFFTFFKSVYYQNRILLTNLNTKLEDFKNSADGNVVENNLERKTVYDIKKYNRLYYKEIRMTLSEILALRNEKKELKKSIFDLNKRMNRKNIEMKALNDKLKSFERKNKIENDKKEKYMEANLSYIKSQIAIINSFIDNKKNSYNNDKSEGEKRKDIVNYNNDLKGKNKNSSEISEKNMNNKFEKEKDIRAVVDFIEKVKKVFGDRKLVNKSSVIKLENNREKEKERIAEDYVYENKEINNFMRVNLNYFDVDDKGKERCKNFVHVLLRLIDKVESRKSINVMSDKKEEKEKDISKEGEQQISLNEGITENIENLFNEFLWKKSLKNEHFSKSDSIALGFYLKNKLNKIREHMVEEERNSQKQNAEEKVQKTIFQDKQPSQSQNSHNKESETFINQMRDKRYFTQEEINYVLLISTLEVYSLLEDLFRDVHYDSSGLIDWASYSLGGRIVHSRTTKSFNTHDWFEYMISKVSETAKIEWLYGISKPIGKSPDILIQKHFNQPGDCFAFHGSQAHVTIQLPALIKVESVSVEHIIFDMNINFKSTPRKFSLYGFYEKTENNQNNSNHKKQQSFVGSLLNFFDLDNRNKLEEINLGDFEFKLSNKQNNLQFFYPTFILPLQRVMFVFTENYGGDYTCVYRLRVHGSKISNV